MPGPGFEPGLLRPQRSVLTTRRSRLTILPRAGWMWKIICRTVQTMHPECDKGSRKLRFARKKLLLVMFLKVRSYSYGMKIYLSGQFS